MKALDTFVPVRDIQAAAAKRDTVEVQRLLNLTLNTFGSELFCIAVAPELDRWTLSHVHLRKVEDGGAMISIGDAPS